MPFLTPALIDVTNVASRPDVELFGPILQMIRVPDFDAALAEAGNTRFGLSASLVGGAPQLYDRFWANVRAGVINWNRPTNGAPSNAPFGGVGLSGRSEEHTSELQSLMRNSSAVFCLTKKKQTK